MTKSKAIKELQALSRDLDSEWHDSTSWDHSGKYRETLDAIIVRVDELEFQLRKKWWSK
jgi:hypothetical protein